MRLTITVSEPARDRRDSIVVEAGPATTVRELLEHLADTHDLGAPGIVCRLADSVLDHDDVLSACGIREGAELTLGAAPADPGRRPDPPLVELHLAAGPGAGRIWALAMGTYDIGADPECAIRIDEPGVPAHGIRVRVGPDGAVRVAVPPGSEVRLGRVYRTGEDAPARPIDPKERKYADEPAPDPNAPIVGEVAWGLGLGLTVGPVLLRPVAPFDAGADIVPSADGTGLDFNRPPRLVEPVKGGRFRIPVRPRGTFRQPFPLLITLAPMLLGLVMVKIFNSYFFLIFAIFSPIMALANWISARRSGRKQFVKDLAAYRVRKAEVLAEVAASAEVERQGRVDAIPDPSVTGLFATGPGQRLWERRRVDPDHLVLRVGTSAHTSLNEVEDSDSESLERRAYWTVPDVPTAVDLTRQGVLGVAGPTGPALRLAGWLVAQAAILHSPRDVQVRLLTGANGADAWGWLAWLPHARGVVRGGPEVLIGGDPETIAARVAELVQVVRARQAASETLLRNAVFADPDIVLVVDGARRLREIPGMTQVLQEGPKVRVFSICVDTEERFLPQECTAVIGLDEGPEARGPVATVRRHDTATVTDVRPDLPAVTWCETIARALAPVRDVTSPDEGALPERVLLPELLALEPPDPATIGERWRRRPASTRVLLGVGYDGPVSFDLVLDGPHALIAGTTGSGKSEMLQSFVAALAAANRPDELTFVLVDYKGGSAFKDCVELPHTLGMVTDLDAQLVHRAMASLGAELTRRELLLAMVGAKDHTEYRGKRLRDPELPALPRLLLIVDEFATLVREVPDFIPGLVGIAQRGRSLGIHMVLATQRPAGVITADIRANTNLRIALRVTDAGESSDVIDTKDAVAISSATPGRALARTSHHTVIPFQTAYAGTERVDTGTGAEPVRALPAASAEPVRPQTTVLSWTRLGRPRPPAVELDVAPQPQPGDAEPTTDLKELVTAIGAAAAALADFTKPPSPWLDPLPHRVLPDELPVPAPAAERPPGALEPVAWAMEDVPHLQARKAVLLDPSTFGHLFVVGAPRTGRSQLLRTMAAALAGRHSCGVVHIQAIDAGGGALAALAELPHCGTVVPRNDLARIDRLISRLGEELSRRQELLSRQACANLTELRANDAHGCPAHVFLLIDGWDPLAPTLYDYDDGRVMNEVVRLLREGAAAGIHLVMTSERALINGRLSSVNDDMVLLRLADRAEYSGAGVPRTAIPGAMPPGRILVSGSWTEAQVCLLGPGESGREQVEALRRIAANARERDRDVDPARRPFELAALPTSIGFAEAYEVVPPEQRRPLWGLLGIGGDAVGAVGADFADAQHTFAVVGPPGSGRSNTLATMAVSLLASGTRVVAITPRDSPLRLLRAHPLVTLVEGADSDGSRTSAAVEELAGPAVVLIDDADLLSEMGSMVGYALREVIGSGRDRGIGLAYAATAETLLQSLSGWLGDVRRNRQGILLSPQLGGEGDLIGARLPTERVRRPLRIGHAWIRDQRGFLAPVLIPETQLRPAAE
ncbi:FtsK/SpoIIIE domain-containing protein [Embleya sp. AB8]|uniref:FtsK/SpoIIIE domain-containing protein n=1 Tax=Embleya sp. AB8 TaxID=3156304 RepID=UPI003C7815A9